MTKGRTRDESGATAVLVALLAVALFSMAAIAVDLGNAWARKRSVQKQADISALSAGYRLPQTSANKNLIAAEVAGYLNNNLASGQAAVTGANLIDGVSSNGEVTFFDNDGQACSEDCTQMTVLAPEARVDFGFAGVMGFDHTDVQRTAKVRVVSALPPKHKMIPLWLPSGCGLGPAESDTSGGGPAPAAPTTSIAPTTSSATATGTGSPSATGTDTGTESASPTVTVSATPTFAPSGDAGTHALNGTSPLSVAANSTTTVSGYTVTSVPANTDRASMRFYSPDGLRFVEYAVTEAQPKGTLFVPPFSVGPEVSDTPGDWRVYAMIQPSGADKTPEYSQTHLVFRVGGEAPSPTSPVDPTASVTPSVTATPSSVPVNCVGQDRGNFGQLDSPRKDGSNKQDRLALNMAKGLDHQLVPFVFASAADITKDCGKVGDSIPGAQLDSAPVDGRNCIQGETGNDGPALYDGLVSGLLGEKGRLDVSRGVTSCPADPSRANTSIGSTTVNNDVLSCFLTNGATLTDITQTSGVDSSMIDPAIVDSPRFVWLPVVYANDRAQKNYQPILEFVPAFITDETQTTPATAANGLEVNGNSVSVLHTFTFSKAALPIDEQSPTIDYDPVVGGSIVRLIG